MPGWQPTCLRKSWKDPTPGTSQIPAMRVSISENKPNVPTVHCTVYCMYVIYIFRELFTLLKMKNTSLYNNNFDKIHKNIIYSMFSDNPLFSHPVDAHPTSSHLKFSITVNVTICSCKKGLERVAMPALTFFSKRNEKAAAGVYLSP